MEGIESNCLCDDVQWPRVPPVLPTIFFYLLKNAITKCFLTNYPTITNNQSLQYASHLGPWMTQIQWKRWKIPIQQLTIEKIFQQVGIVHTIH